MAFRYPLLERNPDGALRPRPWLPFQKDRPIQALGGNWVGHGGKGVWGLFGENRQVCEPVHTYRIAVENIFG
jgi:hypothetical protein